MSNWLVKEEYERVRKSNIKEVDITRGGGDVKFQVSSKRFACS